MHGGWYNLIYTYSRRRRPDPVAGAVAHGKMDFPIDTLLPLWNARPSGHRLDQQQFPFLAPLVGWPCSASAGSLIKFFGSLSSSRFITLHASR